MVERQVPIKDVRERSASDGVSAHQNPRRKRAVPFLRSVELPVAGVEGGALSVRSRVPITKHWSDFREER